MRTRLSIHRVLLAAAVAATFGCRPSEGESESSSATTGESPTSTSSESATGTETGTATESSAATSETGAVQDMANEGSLCSLILQDCPVGQKCVAYNENGGILPDGVKCVDEYPTPDGVGEPCMNLGNFGSGEDTCIKGAMCFDLDNDGEGSCVAHCSGTSENPICPKPEETCVTFFDPPVPLCFASCDPLLQDCPEGEGCYMDAPNIGSEGFVCMPTVLAPNENGDYGDLCYNQAGCAPGFSCIWPENVPNCKYEYCCSPWCDLETDPEVCAKLDPTMECVPWYSEGEAQPGLENLGICGIPL